MSAAPPKRTRGRPHKTEAQKPERDINAERVKAYSSLEYPICDCVNMGTIAVPSIAQGIAI
jgi:hypothetical protein